MTKSNKRRHDNFNSDYYEYRRNDRSPYDQHYGNVYYIDQPPLPPPYYSQIPPPYYYAAQDGGRSPFPLNTGIPPLRDSFYAKRPRVHASDSENSRVARYDSGREKKKIIKDKEKEKRTNKDVKKITTRDKQVKSRDRQKLSLLKRISNGITHGLESFFYKLGMFIACHPKKTIAVAILVAAGLGVGMIRLHTSRDFLDMLIPADSRIHSDQAWVRENIPYELRMVQFVFENDNVLSKEVLLGMHDLYNASYNIRVDGGLGFADFCNNIMGNCYVTSLLSLWANDRSVIEQLTEEEIINTINTTEIDPTYYTPFKPKLLIGDMRRNSDGKIIAGGATIMTWYLMANSTNKGSVQQLENEMLQLKDRQWDGIYDVGVLTLDSFNDEYFDAVYGDIVLLLYVFPFVFIYAMLAMGKPNLVENGMFMVFAAVIGVGLAGAACYGLCLAIGFPFGATHTGLIFLMLGIGVDDCFVVIETWKRVDREHQKKSIEEKMALTMKHAGVSVTVTSVSDFTAFAAGISTVMPILSSFCIYSAFGIFFLFIYQSTFFPACLALEQKRIKASRNGIVPCYKHKNYKPNRYTNIEVLEPVFKRFGKILLTIPCKVFVILVSFGLMGYMTWTTTKLDRGFDVNRSLPWGSSSLKFVTLNEKYFPNNGFPLAVYCATKDYYTYRKELDRMEQLYSNSSAILDGEVTSWIVPFKMYLQYIKDFFNDPVVLDEDGFPEGKENFDKYFYQFITTPGFGDAYKLYIGARNESVIDWTIYRMSSAVALDSATNEARLEEIRNIADNTITDGICFAHGDFFSFAETSKYTFTELTRNLILAGVSVFVVVLLFVVDLRSALFVVLCVAFTMFCLGGTLQLGGFLIDGNILIMTTFCIGLSVDFSAHITYMFMTVKGTKNERAQKTLEKIGPAVLHGAMSTLLAALILFMSKSLTMYLFFVCLVSIMLYGLFAGLILLPVILSLIGPPPYPDAENFKAPPLGHSWYSNALMRANNKIWRIPRPQLIGTPTASGSEDWRHEESSSEYQSSTDNSMEELRARRSKR